MKATSQIDTLFKAPHPLGYTLEIVPLNNKQISREYRHFQINTENYAYFMIIQIIDNMQQGLHVKSLLHILSEHTKPPTP